MAPRSDTPVTLALLLAVLATSWPRETAGQINMAQCRAMCGNGECQRDETMAYDLPVHCCTCMPSWEGHNCSSPNPVASQCSTCWEAETGRVVRSGCYCQDGSISNIPTGCGIPGIATLPLTRSRCGSCLGTCQHTAFTDCCLCGEGKEGFNCDIENAGAANCFTCYDRLSGEVVMEYCNCWSGDMVRAIPHSSGCVGSGRGAAGDGGQDGGGLTTNLRSFLSALNDINDLLKSRTTTESPRRG